MKLYCLFKRFDDPNIDWGIGGNIKLIGVFSSKKKIYQYLLEHRQNIDTDKLPDLKQLLGSDMDDEYYFIQSALLDKIQDNVIADWFYAE